MKRKKRELTIKEQDAALEKERLKTLNKNRLLLLLGISLVTIALLMLYLLQKSKRKAQEERDAIIIKSKEEGLKSIIHAQEEREKRNSQGFT